MAPKCRLCVVLFVNDVTEGAVESAVTLGIAVLQSWLFVHDAASHEHTWATMQACKVAHRRRADGMVLEHVVLASRPFDASDHAIALPHT